MKNVTLRQNLNKTAVCLKNRQNDWLNARNTNHRSHFKAAQSIQQTKGVGFLLRLAVDPLIAIEATFSASPIMNFDIKLFVLIVAMGKVKPNEVSDNQGEIINNNNHRQLL